MRRALTALLVTSLAVPSAAAAQADAMAAALDAISDDAPLALAEPRPFVVHVHTEFEDLAAPLLRSLSRRLEVDVERGAAPPGGLCVAVDPGHACVAPIEDHDTSSALVLLRAEDGRFYETEVTIEAERAPAVRALAIAIVDVRDAARTAPSLPPSSGSHAIPRERGTSWVYVEREGGLFGRHRSIESVARPILYFRFLLGATTTSAQVLVGPGVGLGVCVGDFCAVLEGDVPIVHETRSVDSGLDTLSYRPIFVAARLGYRPLQIGPVTGGISWGLLDRFGNAWLESTGESRIVNDLGMRQSIEISVQFHRPFEIVVEGGFDVTFAPARWTYQSSGFVQLLTDDVVGWGVLAFRVRP